MNVHVVLLIMIIYRCVSIVILKGLSHLKPQNFRFFISCISFEIYIPEIRSQSVLTVSPKLTKFRVFESSADLNSVSPRANLFFGFYCYFLATKRIDIRSCLCCTFSIPKMFKYSNSFISQDMYI